MSQVLSSLDLSKHTVDPLHIYLAVAHAVLFHLYDMLQTEVLLYHLPSLPRLRSKQPYMLLLLDRVLLLKVMDFEACEMVNGREMWEKTINTVPFGLVLELKQSRDRNGANAKAFSA